jgi:two-component system cell cycle response regulator
MATTAAKVLLIDDQPFFITMLRNVLEQQGYQVITAGAGPEGLERARKDSPDVILLDVEMPGMNGFQVCEKLKQDRVLKGIPVVILTATEDTKLNERAFKAGAEITVSKNVPGDRLINILKLAVSKGKPATD